MTFGQKVNDSNNELFTLLYNTSWYMMPLSSQKLILFLLQKTGKELYAVVGMIIVAKMETFASLLVFVTTQYNKELLFRILSFVLPIVFVVMEYMLMIIKAESLKKLIEDIENDWNSIKDKLEIGILEEYANYIKTLTIYAIVLAICYISIFIFTLFQRLPLILDVIFPLNESRPYQHFILTEYFVDQDQYIQYIMLHQCLVYCIGFITVWSIGLSLIIYLTHMCALLKLTRLMTVNYFNLDTLRNSMRFRYKRKSLLLFVMQRNTKNYYFVIEGIFNISLEGFSTVIYYTRDN
ncbi:uncharacterized protein [Cardiocondyla obscurior]|uniref:uncharacterized protein n=1 Tax=Cardiocondyla obscurior TaxID=286306 RepID=UPI003965865A